MTFDLPALPKGWSWGEFGDSVYCPHGNEIEIDGECPEGCVSPVMFLI